MFYIVSPKASIWSEVSAWIKGHIIQPAKSKPIIVIGIGILFVIFCCLTYGLPSQVLKNSEGYQATLTVRAFTRTPTVTFTSKPSVAPTATIIPSKTSEAKATQIDEEATITPEIKQGDIGDVSPSVKTILNVPELFGRNSSEFGDLFGASTEILPFNPGEIPEIPEGGQSRTYQFEGYTFTFFFDMNHLAKGFMLTEGLTEINLPIEKTEEAFMLLGVDVNVPADVDAPAGRHWDNFQGLKLKAFTLGMSQPLSTILIWETP